MVVLRLNLLQHQRYPVWLCAVSFAASALCCSRMPSFFGHSQHHYSWTAEVTKPWKAVAVPGHGASRAIEVGPAL